MNIVNPWFLHDLMSPITGLADDDEAVVFYRDQNIKTEEQYRAIIREKFVEYYYGLANEKKQKSKLTLSYFLSKSDASFERVFDSCLPPFDPPKDARDFFVWLWEELFGDESYLIADLSSFKEISNIFEPNRPGKK